MTILHCSIVLLVGNFVIIPPSFLCVGGIKFIGLLWFFLVWWRGILLLLRIKLLNILMRWCFMWWRRPVFRLYTDTESLISKLYIYYSWIYRTKNRYFSWLAKGDALVTDITVQYLSHSILNRGLLVASRGHFPDNGCVSAASGLFRVRVLVASRFQFSGRPPCYHGFPKFHFQKKKNSWQNGTMVLY